MGAELDVVCSGGSNPAQAEEKRGCGKAHGGRILFCSLAILELTQMRVKTAGLESSGVEVVWVRGGLNAGCD